MALGREEWTVKTNKSIRSFFTKVAPKVKEEAPAPSKAKAKAFKAKETVLKGVHNHKK